ncbi:TolB-like translocation protein [Gorillibacterium timonense]|uniref:hypothetical protein n=1 Tax=Gorillibacterium timonense TaxID=1689269 RepID=UPI00071D52A5|nr:hypothetical protein [Gorillibacterium timonense]
MKKSRVLFILALCLLLVATGCGQAKRSGAVSGDSDKISVPSPVHTSPSDWLWFTSGDEHYLLNLTDALAGKETAFDYKEFTRSLFRESWANSLYPEEFSSDGNWVHYGIQGPDTSIKPFYYHFASSSKRAEDEIGSVSKEMASPLRYTGDQTYAYEQNGSLIPLKLSPDDQVKGDLNRMAYSPDRQRIAYQGEDADHGKYLLIYDLEQGKITDQIKVGRDLSERDFSFYISQWHSNGSILLTINHEAYRYDTLTKQLLSLGTYLFYPLLTPDGSHLIYSKPINSVSEDEVLTQLPDYGETGLFMKDLQGDAPPRKILDQDALQIADQDIQPRQIFQSSMIVDPGSKDSAAIPKIVTMKDLPKDPVDLIPAFLDAFAQGVESGNPSLFSSYLISGSDLTPVLDQIVKDAHSHAVTYKVVKEELTVGAASDQAGEQHVPFRAVLYRDGKSTIERVELNSTAILKKNPEGVLQIADIEDFLKK